MTSASGGPGCVIVRLQSGAPSRLALEAAVELARGLRSELQSLFVEDKRLFSLAGLPCAREVSMSGRRAPALSIERLQQDMHSAAESVRHEFERLAHAAGIPFRFGIVREEPDDALERCCQEGAILALAEPLRGEEVASLAAIVHGASSLRGVMLVGPRGRRRSGPVVLAAESVGDVGGLIEMGARLVSPMHREIVLLMLAEERGRFAALEAELRRMLDPKAPVRVMLAEARSGVAAAIANALSRLSGGFLVARLAGRLDPAKRELRLLTAAIECPALLVR